MRAWLHAIWRDHDVRFQLGYINWGPKYVCQDCDRMWW